MANFGEIKDYQQNELDLKSGDSYIDSTVQGQDINRAYYTVKERINWPDNKDRDADIVVANVDRYDLPSDFIKFDFLIVQGTEYKEVALNDLPYENRGYSVVHDTGEYIISTQPTSASTAFTLSNNETAGSSVTIELDTVDGLSAGTEIWIDDSTSSEFTLVQSVDTDNTTITAKLANNHNSAVKLYDRNDIIYFSYHSELTELSSDSDTPDIPTPLHLGALAEYSCYLYFKRQKDQEAANEYLQNYEREIRNFFMSRRKNSTGYLSQVRTE